MTYSEHVLCSGKNQRSHAVDYGTVNDQIVPVISVKIRDLTFVGGGDDAPGSDGSELRYECDGAFVHISLGPAGKATFAAQKKLTGFYDREIVVTITGVVDVAGNEGLVGAGENSALLTLEGEECPGIEWAGRIKRDGGFVVTGHSDAPVSIVLAAVDVSNGGWVAGGVTAVRFQFRMLGTNVWKTIISATLDDVVDTSGIDVQQSWVIDDHLTDPDGVYELRGVTSCGHGTQSSTKIVHGVIDQIKPRIVTIETTSKGNTFVETDAYYSDVQ